MAKAAKKKTEEVIPTPEVTETPSVEVLENIEPVTESPVEIETIIVEEKPVDEVLFLKRILQIQEEGGWGKHLHPIINERINQLKGG